MGNELAPPPPENYEASVAQLVETNRHATIRHNGVEMPFGRFVQMQEMCGRQFGPDENVAEVKASDITNIAAENGLIVPEDLERFIKPKEVLDTEPDKKVKSLEKAKVELTESQNGTADEKLPAIGDFKLVSKIQPEQIIKVPPMIHPEVMARLVTLETPRKIAEPRFEITTKQPIKSVKVKPLEKATPLKIDTIEKVTVEAIIGEPEKPEIPPFVFAPAVEFTIERTVLDEADSLGVEERTELIETLPEDSLIQGASFVEDQSSPLLEESFTGIDNLDNEVLPPLLNEFIEPDLSQNYDTTEIAETKPLLEELEKSPAVAVAEFMLQVLPAVTQEVYERVQEMEPEEAAEVAAQIETISIVADRLHELVVAGKTESEEAQQIEAYLKREYEQLLVSVGVEPTEAIINDFIRYIYSAEYQIQAQLNMDDVEVIDEGTHEKKMFDEQGVFSRAHAASINLKRRLDRSIGQLVVNYLN